MERSLWRTIKLIKVPEGRKGRDEERIDSPKSSRLSPVRCKAGFSQLYGGKHTYAASLCWLEHSTPHITAVPGAFTA